MDKMSFKKCILILSAVLLSVPVSAKNKMTRAEYIEKYKHYALKNQDSHGIPASITMAQGILESDCGNSRLAVQANNHFGIKCKSTWTGPTIKHTDDAPNECFRKYVSPEASFRDHSEFLTGSTRYASLFELDPLDYKGWAYGLKQAGYATNPKYAEMLIKVIEESELYALDGAPAVSPDLAQVLPEQDIEPAPEQLAEKVDVDNYVVTDAGTGSYASYINNGTMFVVAGRGDTYKSMSGKLRISEKKLRKFNDAGKAYEPIEGEPVYVKSKSNKAINGKLMHTVADGETMHSISQKYGIKLNKLAKLNRRPASSPVRPGSQIRLM